MQESDQYEISTERSRLDFALIHEFLHSSYWARGIPRDVLEKAIQHSLCFGAYYGGQQVGFARVVTDFATFAYIADVFVVPEHRGHGVSKMIMNAILAHPELQGMRRILLATHDAHKLYAQFGFEPLGHPDQFMSIHKPGLYEHGESNA
jgi:N-acetylglutamate synthase-like GNAT family acetyltransferase